MPYVSKKVPICDVQGCKADEADEWVIGVSGDTRRVLICKQHARPLRNVLVKLPKQKKPASGRAKLTVVRAEDIPER